MVVSKLTNLFPPPKFLKVEWIGLDMTDESARLLELIHKHKGFRLGYFAEEAIAKGAMVSGQIFDRKALVFALKELRKKSPTPYINASLPEEKSFLFTVEVADGDEDQIRQNIEYILEENIPIPPAETLFEFDIISRNEREGRVLVSVTAIHTRIVEEYTSIFSEAGFVPYSLEVEGRPLVRTVIPRGERGTYVVVNYNERNVGLFLVVDEIIRFTSTVKLDESEIPELFKKDGKLDLDGYVNYEIEKIHTYWRGKEGNEKFIDIIYLVGLKASNNNLIALLRENSKAKVEIANVWVNVFGEKDVAHDIDQNKSLQYATAIGLALKGR